MIQLLPARGSFGSSLGKSLGTGLAGAFENFQQQKAREAQQKQLEQAGLPGVLASLDPQVQAAYLREYGAAQKQQQMQQQQADLAKLLDESLSPGASAQSQGVSLLGQQQEAPAQDQQSLSPSDQQQQKKEPAQKMPLSSEAKILSDIENLEKKLEDPRISPTQKEFLRERRDKLQERADKKIATAEKETKDYYKQLVKEAKSAQQSSKRLDRMEELISKGNLSNPQFASLLDTLSKGIFGFGIDLPSLLSTDSQEFKKLSTDFLKEAKDIFGARLTDADVKYFLQTVPTLSQSNVGKQRVIDNLRNFNRASEIKRKVAEEIIKENRGVRPRNLESLVDKRASKELDKLANDFKKDKGTRPIPTEEGFFTSLIRGTGAMPYSLPLQ